MASIGKIARRSFLIGSAAIVGGVAFGAWYINRPAPNPLKPGKGDAVFNPFVMISRDRITLIAPRAEMGQGVRTTWAALIAEELDVDLDQVTVLHGPAAAAYYNAAVIGETLPDRGYNRSEFTHWLGETLGPVGKVLSMQITGGSTSMKDGFERMRAAGASARETLKAVAAERLGVDHAALKTERGRVIAPDGTEIAYTDLAEAAAGRKPVEADLRDRSQWRLLGRSQPRVDMVGKVTGTAQFGIDLRLPGMKFASVKRNPRQGGGMKGFDASDAKSMPGVERIVDIGDGVAVVATNTWLAMQALEAIEIDWEDAPYPADTAGIFARIDAAFDATPNSTMRDDGDADTLPAGATEVTAEYRLPYLAHATMEPMNTTALFTGDRLELWSPNQAPTFVAMKAAEAVGLETEAVEVHTTYLGGGFGRRAEFDYAVVAAKVAKALPGTPVQVTWSREEDMSHDMYRPGAVARMRGAVRDGRAVLLDGRIAAQSATQSAMMRMLGTPGAGPDKVHVEGAFNQPYAIPNYRIRGYLADLAIPVGFWRSVGNSFNGFFMESFIDEMAHAAGRDPLEFRLELARAEWEPAAKVLEAVREMSGWTGKTPDGVGRGVAMTYSFGTPVAEVIEVRRADDGIRIANAWIAVDPGIALDPENVKAQMFGGMAYGLSAACFGEITFADGAAEQLNFPDYDAIRMHTMPRVEVRVLENQDHLGGVGEPGTPPAAPALANALFDLTGKRARRLPLMHEFDLIA
ncbi:xanthine dehydrogenase family protein molybdopterin-binding subunit [Jhaorihella thermophila]|uniref:Isoquinoline 1-oxidoreductase, beta subunit n=1 Tax=Jhaorihella thermophila TaxID=488547 RepID=A0A1H5WVT8_9RHOB|nr:molybdopterin cofactor-binding domain-containing protein [Jhaorihella thermophila]SEG03548.1 isoquinoline 1-oxidoreductase, beta subunit [Jhaorihella thermophila]